MKLAMPSQDVYANVALSLFLVAMELPSAQRNLVMDYLRLAREACLAGRPLACLIWLANAKERCHVAY